MYLVPFSDPKDYPKPIRPRAMQYSAAFWVKEETLLLLETWKFKEFYTDKQEGIALLEDGKTLAIIADNDFAVTEDKPTKLWLVELPERLR
jgi:hypothetical protein